MLALGDTNSDGENNSTRKFIIKDKIQFIRNKLQSRNLDDPRLFNRTRMENRANPPLNPAPIAKPLSVASTHRRCQLSSSSCGGSLRNRREEEEGLGNRARFGTGASEVLTWQPLAVSPFSGQAIECERESSLCYFLYFLLYFVKGRGIKEASCLYSDFLDTTCTVTHLCM